MSNPCNPKCELCNSAKPNTESDKSIDEPRTLFWETMCKLVLDYNLYTFDPNIKEMEQL